MVNSIKYSGTSEGSQLNIDKWRFGGIGDTQTTGFYAGVDIPQNGYVIYRYDNTFSQIRAHVANTDGELISLLRSFGSTGTTISEVLIWSTQQDDLLVINDGFENIVTDGLVLYLDAAKPQSYPGSGSTVFNIVSSTVYPSVSLFGNTSYGSISNGVVNISGESNNSSSGVILRGSGSLGNTINNDFTSIGWLYRTSNKSGEVLSYRQSSFRCSFDIVNNSMIFYQRESVSPYTTRSTSVSITNNLNTWYCFALTKSGNSWSFYRNGTLIGTNTFTMTETITGNHFHIGGAWSDDDYLSNCMDGSIGPIMHYTRALTASEIQQNYNALRSRHIT